MTTTTADLIVFGARVTTLDDVTSDDASAFAVRGERFVAVGAEGQVMRRRAPCAAASGQMAAARAPA